MHTVGKFFKGDDLIYTFGGDFQYGDARVTYMNQQTLMKHINANTEKYKLKLIYSTPGEYIRTINKKNYTFPENTFDFFPYRDYPLSFWTGFYTSRVALKGMTK